MKGYWTILILLAMGLFGEWGFGQSAIEPTVILRGNVFPENAVEGNWFFNVATKKVYAFKEGEWDNVVSGECKSVEACRDYVFVETDEDYKAFYGNGSTLGLDCKGFFCSDSVVGFWSENLVLFQDARDSILTVMTNLITPCDLNVQRGKLRGETVFCIPQYFDGSLQYSCEELHTWGLLGEKGRWVVPPQFDEPFTFVDGVAEVKYKGKSMKINENGETVE